jgi:hypothetical protein
MELVNTLRNLLAEVRKLTPSADDKPVLLLDQDTFFAVGHQLNQKRRFPNGGSDVRTEGILEISLMTPYGEVRVINKQELARISNTLNRMCE